MGYDLGGSFALGPWRVRRAGYGAMQLAGDGFFGPPRERDEALLVLRAAVEAGVDHIDTAQFYGAGTVNQLIREALHPYPDGLAIVSKVAARRDPQPPAQQSGTRRAWRAVARDAGADRARLAARPRAEHPAHPRHPDPRPPGREPRSRRCIA
jgi:aryl-alcohol dehydrogenase-like predicted oxidoreductase